MENERNDLTEIEGVIENIIYSNEANGYSVCEMVLTENELITVVGIMPYIAVGERVKAMGNWGTHATYGKQFKVEFYEKQLPADEETMVKYLSSNAIKGLGAVTAKRIVQQFGRDTFDVIESHPEWLQDIKGINPKKAQEISESFKSQFGVRSIMLFCHDFFGPSTVLKIYKRWGSAAVDVIKQNPFILCDEINGISFERADNLAQSLGFDKNSRQRIMAGIKHALSYNAYNNGHVFVPREKLSELAANMLDANSDDVEDALAALELARQVVTCDIFGRACTYLAEYYDAEKYIVKKTLLLDAMCEKTAIDDIERMISQIEAEEGIIYAKLQRKAIIAALNNGVMLLTGGPGTGKTTIIRAVIRLYERMGNDIVLAAPTGRAAKRMSEATQYEAKTIHRLLEMEFSGDDNARFGKNEKNLLEENVIIIDEASMVDTMLMEALLKAVKPGARLILIGDADQLPSVGPGNVICNMIESERFATVMLDEIFRQAQESRIVTNAHAINSGELPVLTDKKGDFFFISRENENDIVPTIIDLCKNRLPKTYGVSVTDGIQIITPSHKGIAGTDILNVSLQNVLNPPDRKKREKKVRDTIFREGDKVMQIKNDYDLEWERYGEKGSGVFNGDIGMVKTINPGDESMEIIFDDRVCIYSFDKLDELEHAYSITVHKSQGSEYPVVIIPMYRYSPRLLTRNLLYTAVTRAKKMVILVGQMSVVQSMVENKRLTKRYTGLTYFLSQYE